jgi:uncharacterized protein (DUF2237 family)
MSNPIPTTEERNVFGEPLEPCSIEPITGFFRTGACACGPEGIGRHLVCAEMTADFLAFSKARGNDLSTPVREYGFPGLVPGDRWCLQVLRWKQAYEAGAAPRVYLRATNATALEVVPLAALKAHALDLS